MLCSWQFIAFSQKSTLTMPESGDCPTGYCAGITIILETLNFHKPRTDCKSLFGFCLRIHAGASCIPCYQKSTPDEKRMEITGMLRENEVVLYIPNEINQLKEFNENDAETFELLERMLEIEYPDGSVKYARAGNYPVVLENNSYTIHIPVE